MIKLVVFDLDGVLVESKDTHFKAFNMALADEGASYVISSDQHLKSFDGLPTNKKLEKLTRERGLPEEAHERVWYRKQECTFDVIRRDVKEDIVLQEVFQKLSEDGYKIYIASNSIRKTTKLYLLKLGLMEYIDEFISAEDVKHPKPNCEMYLKAMLHANAEPGQTMIVEDSHVGITAAVASGGHLCRVETPADVTVKLIFDKLLKLNGTRKQTAKWQGGQMNILVPMAGAGSRFSVAGFTFPKPLVEVNGQPMIQTVVNNINIEARYIYIVRKEHYEKYNLQYMLNMITPNCEVVQVDELTEGACCTTLLAEEYINNDEPLMIANSDQYIEWDSSEFMYTMTAGKSDGGVLIFENSHPKWSYAKIDDQENITEIAEKKVISNMATVGIYYWTKGEDYVKYAKQMIQKDIRINGEFYVAPVYNEAIADGHKFKTYNIEKMWGLGTPEDLDYFLKHNEA
ncbi:MAG: HAD-IA family hydrolase [Pontiella sp.]